MNRRRILALVGALASIPAGYYGWSQYRSPSLPDNMDVETRYLTGNVFGEPAPAEHDVGPREQYHRVIEGADTAAKAITFNDTAIGFAEATDFNESYLIVVQTGMQSAPDLVLEAISRTDEGLHLAVAVAHPSWRGVDDDLITHSLLVRITDQTHDRPEAVSVAIAGYV